MAFDPSTAKPVEGGFDVSTAKPVEEPKQSGLRKLIEPTVEALGTAGGGALGSVLGPPGVVLGAGLGYAGTKEAMRLFDEFGGTKPARTPEQAAKETAKDILTGATFEAGGRAAAPLIEKGVRGITSGAGRIADWWAGIPAGKQQAAKVAREALGVNLPKARKVLAEASQDVTAGQALAKIDPTTGKPVINAPVAQAMLQRAAARDPTFFTDLLGAQEGKRLETLFNVAGGRDATAAREAQEALKRTLNEQLIPILERELGAANIAGQAAPRYRETIEKFGKGAAEKVEDVRRFTRAGEKALDQAKKTTLPGYPRLATRYTYMGELADRAEKAAADAAEGSLRFGDARRFAEAGLQSLEAHGLRELKGDTIVNAIAGKLRDPSLAGNRDIQRTLGQVAEDIQQWTNAGGVIDAWALDSIRKNSVNTAIRQLYPAADKFAQKELAAKVLTQVRPLIIDAVERAGGTGYGNYLRSYQQGSQIIGQTKLGGEAMRLYLSSPEKFVQLVEGNAPEVVEQIFGSGNYNIAKQLSSDLQYKLQQVGREVTRGLEIGKQATAGEKAFADLLRENIPKYRLPFVLKAEVTATNQVIAALERKVGKDTMRALTEASRSARSFEDLLNTIPATERNKVLAAIRDPNTWEGIRGALGGAAAGVDRPSEPIKRRIPRSAVRQLTQPQLVPGVENAP